MLIIEHTVETSAHPSQVWKMWEDVNNWNVWDDGLEFSTIEGPFQTGTRGRLKPKGSPLVQTVLTQVKPMEMFVDEASLPLTKIIVSHLLKREGKTTLVTHRIEMKGLLSWFFGIVIGRNMKKNLPKEMEAMVKLAESR